jgi:hypothetical protein
MFSSITIASSTTKPTEIVSAISERLSRLKPTRYMTAAVPSSASGTVTLGISVAGTLRRKTKITITTSAIVSISVNSTSCTEARIVCVRSIEDVDLDGRRDRGLELRQRGLDRVDRLDHVGARLLGDHEHDAAVGGDAAPGVGGAGIGPRRDLVVLRRVDGAADVANAHRRAVLVGEHDVVPRLGAQELVVGVGR